MERRKEGWKEGRRKGGMKEERKGKANDFLIESISNSHDCLYRGKRLL